MSKSVYSYWMEVPPWRLILKQRLLPRIHFTHDLWGENKGTDRLCNYCITDPRLRFCTYILFVLRCHDLLMSLTYPFNMHIDPVQLPFILPLSPYLTEKRQLEISARLVHDKFATISRQGLTIKTQLSCCRLISQMDIYIYATISRNFAHFFKYISQLLRECSLVSFSLVRQSRDIRTNVA